MTTVNHFAIELIDLWFIYSFILFLFFLLNNLIIIAIDLFQNYAIYHVSKKLIDKYIDFFKIIWYIDFLKNLSMQPCIQIYSMYQFLLKFSWCAHIIQK